jgi:hypothetical protein
MSDLSDDQVSVLIQRNAELEARVKELEIAAGRKPSYAGMRFWLGGHQIERHITEAQIKYEMDSGSSLTNAAQECLDLLAEIKKAAK